MSDLEIPDAAYEVAVRAPGQGAAVDAAAPLIVAAELRRLAKTWNSEIPVINSTYVRQALCQRADELDPEGLTK
jgi:hypothetical protein